MTHDRLRHLFPERAERTLPWPDAAPTVTLWRPVGLLELRLIRAANWRAYPPRLPDQPIFYPVLNFEYAEEIARDWNAPRPPYAGFVTRFEVQGDFVRRYAVQVVGSEARHLELWVPAEDLEAFNAHLVGPVEVVAAYYGPGFRGERDPLTKLPLDL
ncbi:hypothetical protein HNR42_003208 [Deinobacterium chartae]|uniref:ADP-ribosylation/crystallin J1 n=1 Tax=Deinobacterium chartae TaxID=521158 RepID=A0A841I5N6_9DEIO|nr:hypothetical protein [Deinobacterium chartae]MBB6099750.1 hypothetical protein [Deinobacterium chartae]